MSTDTMHPSERLFRNCLADLLSLADRVESNERRPSADQIAAGLRRAHDQLLSLLHPPPDESQTEIPPAITPPTPGEDLSEAAAFRAARADDEVRTQAPARPAYSSLDPSEPIVLPSTDQNGQTTVAEDAAHVESAGAEGADGGQPVDAAGHVSRSEEA